MKRNKRYRHCHFYVHTIVIPSRRRMEMEKNERMIIVSVSSRVHTRVDSVPGYSRSKPASRNHYSLMWVINRSSANSCSAISSVAVVHHVLIIANAGLVVKWWSIARSPPRFEVIFRDFQSQFRSVFLDDKRFLVPETTINQ